MAARKRLLSALILIAAVAAPGCTAVSDSPRNAAAQDVEFLRGCWVSKDLPGGPPTAFLRLLPDGAGGPAYAGSLIDVRDGKWIPGVRFEFAHDGSRAVVTRPDAAARTYLRTENDSAAPAPDGSRAVYSDGRDRLIAQGGSEGLTIQEGTSSPITALEFERDGCD